MPCCLSRPSGVLAPALLWVAALLCSPSLWAQSALPASVMQALAQTRIPLDAISLQVAQADGTQPPHLSHRADAWVNPASVMKLVTTFAALDLLGPAYTWRTPVWLDGTVADGVLTGNLVIQGQGDPKLVQERLWLLLRRVQGLGVQRIDGDIVLDGSAFAAAPVNPADFDGEPLRPYNASPQALLINFKSVTLTLTPDPANGVARVLLEPPLWGVQAPLTVPLDAAAADCGDYRRGLGADFADPQRIGLSGSYPAVCGEKTWSLAYADPASFSARAVLGLWQSLGGQLRGRVREGTAPSAPARFELTSPTLAEVIRDINKFSNNVMAQQLFLTLARAPLGAEDSTGTAAALPSATADGARQTLRSWWQQRINPATQRQLPAPVLDNGSGLSRQARISAEGLTRLLQVAYTSPYSAELMASLPIVGVDGTLKRSQATRAGAHLKTGSLRDVLALAGYVHASQGRNLSLVAIINHPNANAARPVMAALVDWAVQQGNAPQADGAAGR